MEDLEEQSRDITKDVTKQEMENAAHMLRFQNIPQNANEDQHLVMAEHLAPLLNITNEEMCKEFDHSQIFYCH